MNILLTQDLIFGSQVSAAAKDAGCELREAPTPGYLRKLLAELTVDRVIIDLTTSGVREELETLVPELKSQEPAPEVIAYGPHVHEGALAAARASGCDRVLSRGQFHSEIGTMFVS